MNMYYPETFTTEFTYFHFKNTVLQKTNRIIILGNSNDN